jgi:hypothetical protein
MDVNTGRVSCPLCKAILKQNAEDTDAILAPMPPVLSKSREMNPLTKWLLLLSFFIVGGSVLVNLFFWDEVGINGLWSLAVFLIVELAWWVSYGCVYYYRHFGANFAVVLLLLGGLSATLEYLVCFNAFDNLFITLKFVVPALFVVYALTLALRSFVNHKHYGTDCAFIIVSALLYLAYMATFLAIDLFNKVDTYCLIFSGFACGLVVLGLFVIAPKQTIRELKKAFFI